MHVRERVLGLALGLCLPAMTTPAVAGEAASDRQQRAIHMPGDSTVLTAGSVAARGEPLQAVSFNPVATDTGRLDRVEQGGAVIPRSFVVLGVAMMTLVVVSRRRRPGEPSAEGTLSAVGRL